MKKRRIRFAVVGQGYFAQIAVLPAFARARNAELVALVSDDPHKLRSLGRTYDVEKLIGYDGYDALLASGEIDAVYIALPNSMHRDFTERAARAGIHVLCEKPLGVTLDDCEAMITACAAAGVKLMTAYRLHFEPGNLAAADLIKKGRIGDARLFTSTFTMNVAPGNIRLSRALGGGPLWDIGVYCVNAARTLFRAEPFEVFAYGGRRDDERFSEVHEQVTALMRFPDDRLGTFAISFGAADTSAYRVVGTTGHLRVEPAYDFAGDISVYLKVGKRKEQQKVFKMRDQVAPEIIYFASCILEDLEPEPSGREGLADVRVINGIYQSLQTGAPVRLVAPPRVEGPDLAQAMSVPPHPEPDMVDAHAPSAD